MARKHTFPAKHGDTFVFRMPDYGDVVFMAVWSNNLLTKMHLLPLAGIGEAALTGPKVRWELPEGLFEPAKPMTASQWRALDRLLVPSGVRVFKVANLGDAVKHVVAAGGADRAAF